MRNIIKENAATCTTALLLFKLRNPVNSCEWDDADKVRGKSEVQNVCSGWHPMRRDDLAVPKETVF